MMETPQLRIELDGSPAYLEGFWQPKGGAPCLIILPGGAFLTLSAHEGDPVAHRFYAEGFSAFVLHYSVGPDISAARLLCEAAQAVLRLRTQAKARFGCETPIALCGFSAGGYLAALLGTKAGWAARRLNRPESAVRPDRVILAYARTSMERPIPLVPASDLFDDAGGVPDCFLPALRTAPGKAPVLDFEATMQTGLLHTGTPAALDAAEWSPLSLAARGCPPFFIWATRTDALIPCAQSTLFAARLASLGVPAAYTLYESGPHGLGLAEGTPAAAWVSQASAWLNTPDSALERQIVPAYAEKKK